MLSYFWQYSGVTKGDKTQLIVNVRGFVTTNFLWFKRGLQETDRKHGKSCFSSDVITGESVSKN